MMIKEIEWLDKWSKEAILEVVSGSESLRCFSHPCSYGIGDTLNEKLECLDVKDIVICDTPGYIIKKMEDAFAYEIKGKLVDKQNGFIEVNGFYLHIDENIIPKDIPNEKYIQFIVSRIDLS